MKNLCKLFGIIVIAAVTVFTTLGCSDPSGPGSVTGVVSVTGVSLDKSSVSLVVGSRETLTATITPTGATNKNITWSSSNESAATVSGGVVTAVAAGNAVITVTTADGGYQAGCAVTVSNTAISVTGVSLKSSTYLVIGGAETLFANVIPANATNKAVSWNSSNVSVAAVSDGVVTAVAAGNAVITVTTTDGGYQANCTVTVSSTAISVTDVSLNKPSASLFVGETEVLTATITPSNATNQNITWSSSAPSVAAVSAGLVTAVGAGNAVITVTTTDGGKTAACNVTVSTQENVAPVTKVSFTEATATVSFSGLTNNDIYLVKVNTSNSVVTAGNTGGPSGSSPSIAGRNLLPSFNDALPRMGHPAADEFNANPPPIVNKGPRRSQAALAAFAPPVVGNTRNFWVEQYFNNGVWVQKQATLRATGQYGNIWVMDENYGSGGGNKITTAQAQAMASKFDLIYPRETNLLGYEWGGGPGGDGGADGDLKIQILIYSIVDASGKAQAGGFFWAKDLYEQSDLDSYGLKTNMAEIFYVDASEVNASLDYIYSTLVHEFQHMIHFNVKTVQYDKNSETWYNEMLSMLAEDVISPLIGVTPSNSAHRTKQSIPTFLSSYYTVGITEWGTGTPNEVATSYAKGYAFGAYLLRNYGGASLLKEMLANDSTNTDSITAALRTVTGNSGLSFEESLRRFGEAMVFSGTMPAGVWSFDKTVAKTIGSYTYTATKFNIWSDFGTTKPKIFGSTEQVAMRPFSITVHQNSAWKGKSGSFSITLQRPSDQYIEFYLMVK
jgi:uncharacterized protein YjdB